MRPRSPRRCVIELTHRLETAQSSADTRDLQAALEESQGKLLDAESKIALLRPEVDALHRLLTEKEQEILLLKESARAAGPTVEAPASVVDASMPAIAKAGGDGSPDTGDARSDSEIDAAPTADGARPPAELPPEFAPPTASGDPSSTAGGVRTNGLAEDDLTAIAGIGPATARRLRQEGLTSFAHIAALSDEAIDELAPKLKNAAVRIRSDRWVEQARKLVAERTD